MSSRIEQLIDEIEEYIESCKPKFMSSTEIIVNKDDIDELLRELRMKTPDEIKRYQKIISNKEAILNDARVKAEALINEATVHTNELINEHEIMQQAYAQANEIVEQATQQAQQIVDSATEDANAIRGGAMQYTDDVLANLQNIITHTMENVTIKYDNFMKSLNTSLDVVTANRQELNPPQDEPEAQQDESAVSDEELDDLEDFDIGIDD